MGYIIKELFQKWSVDKTKVVIYSVNAAGLLKGKFVDCDNIGVLIEVDSELTFSPWVSILNICETE